MASKRVKEFWTCGHVGYEHAVNHHGECGGAHFLYPLWADDTKGALFYDEVTDRAYLLTGGVGRMTVSGEVGAEHVLDTIRQYQGEL